MIGIDEVGRGCLAGPLLVVAAHAKNVLPPGLRDSKKLSSTQRAELLDKLMAACDFGEGWVTPHEINGVGLSGAMKFGVARALAALKAKETDEIWMDGRINYCEPRFDNVNTLVGGDDLIEIISAASIYAKVKRDNYMKSLSAKYSGYGFEKHVGYGTKLHLEAIANLGVLMDFHRLNYVPVKKAIHLS